MMKRFFHILLITTLLSGCTFIPQKPESISLDRPEVKAGDAQTLIVWGLFEDKESLQPLFDKFTEKYPDVKIDYAKKDEKTYYTELNDVVADDNPDNTPDIFMIHNSWVGNYESYTTTAPESIFPYSAYSSTFHDFVAEDFAYNQSVRGVPLWVDLLGIVYHKSLLTETGNTEIATDWNNFILQSQKMTKRSTDGKLEIAGFSAANAANVEFYFDTMNLLFLQSRTLPLTAEAREVPFAEDEKTRVENAVRFYRSFGDSPSTWEPTLKKDSAFFIEGKLASIIVPSWRILTFLSYNERLGLGYELGTAEVPQLNPDNIEKVDYPTYWGFIVSKDSTKVNESWNFLKFISEKEQQELYKKTVEEKGRPFSLISPRKDMLESYSSNEYLKPYAASIANAHSWRMINGEKLKPSYEALLTGDVKLDKLLEDFQKIKSEADKL